MKTAERNRKRIYRVIAGHAVFSSHGDYHLALVAEGKAENYAALGKLGLTPDTLVHVERWSAKYGTWERIS